MAPMAGNEDPAAGPSAEAQQLAPRKRRAAVAARARQLDHDLRTPLGTLGAALELLRSGGPADPGLLAESLEVMGRQVLRLHGLAQRLHDLASELEREEADRDGDGPLSPQAGSEQG